ncbi:hypothetical protein SNEBB_011065 [Seison nebaliae]|nr:hypothetical protein SNEBB_011065 [Seison nebaliae]
MKQELISVSRKCKISINGKDVSPPKRPRMEYMLNNGEVEFIEDNEPKKLKIEKELESFSSTESPDKYKIEIVNNQFKDKTVLRNDNKKLDNIEGINNKVEDQDEFCDHTLELHSNSEIANQFENKNRTEI